MGEISLRRHQTKGQIIIIFIILIILGLIVISGLISIFSGRDRSAPIIREAYWLVDGQKASTCNVGEEVKAHIVIEPVEQYAGSIVVKIRKDVRLWPDADFAVSTIPVVIAGGDQEVIDITFTPDEATHGGLTGLRGYFIEIEFKATRTTWTMENSYPPRLTVKA
jgi:hypothetical protein